MDTKLRRLLRRMVAALAGALLVAGTAQAGRSCEDRPLTTGQLVRGMELAAQAAANFDLNGDRVVAIGRAGKDLSKYGLRWSHMGWAYRTDDGAWRVVHKLNQCGTAHAGLYRQGLGQFFMDDLWRYDMVSARLTPEVQARLLPLLRYDRALQRMDEPRYSMVAYAWGQRYQQSNQWALETFALAMAPEQVFDRGSAQDWLRRSGYQPSTLVLGPLARLGGRIGNANIAFDDHPAEKRFSDRIETVTVDSVMPWLTRGGWASSYAVIRGR